MSPYAPLQAAEAVGWGIGMTVCIASTTAYHEIVTASDHMLSMGAFSADDVAIKIERICADWFVMWACDDVGVVPGLIRRVMSTLNSWDDVVYVSQMAENVKRTFQAERLE